MLHFFRKRRYYISPLDKLLAECHQKPRTPSQQYEIDKHKRIAILRDRHPDYLSTDASDKT